MKLIWSPKSKQRITEILEYISKDNPIAAFELVAEFETKADSLIRNPVMGREISIGQKTDARELVVHKNYSLIYQITDETIEILTIRHFRQQHGTWKV